MTLYRVWPPQGISALRPWCERHPLLSKDLPTKRNMVGTDWTNDDNESGSSPNTTLQGLHADNKSRLVSLGGRFWSAIGAFNPDFHFLSELPI